MTNKKKLTLVVLVTLLIISVTIAVSYAYWKVSKTQESTNVISTACFDVQIQNENNAIDLKATFPKSDEAGAALTPFTFTVKNTCSSAANFTLNLEVLAGTTLSTDYVAIMLDNEAKQILGEIDEASVTKSDSVEARRLTEGYLRGGESIQYSLRLWLDKDTPYNSDTIDKTFSAKVVVVANAVNSDDRYALSGTFVNDSNQPIQNAYLAFDGGGLKIIKTDIYGTVYIDDLSKGRDKIYYLNVDPTGMNLNDIIAAATATATVDVESPIPNEIVFSNGYKIVNAFLEDTKETPLNSYEITFNGDNGESYSAKTVTQNKIYGELPSPSKSGYTFNGWYQGDKLITSEVIVTASSSHELTAHWGANSYIVTFNANGGSLATEDLTKSVSFNSTYGEMPTPTRDGFDFVGWFTDENEEITSSSLCDLNDNIQLYAHWTEANNNNL